MPTITASQLNSHIGSRVRFTTGLRNRTFKTEGVVTGLFNYKSASQLADIAALNAMTIGVPNRDVNPMASSVKYFGVESDTGVVEIFSTTWVSDIEVIDITSTVYLKVLGLSYTKLVELIQFGTNSGYSIEVLSGPPVITAPPEEGAPS